MKKAMQSYQGQSQTHSELLKTIIFPKNNIGSIKNKLPVPRYTDVMSEKLPPNKDEKTTISATKNQSQATKDSSGQVSTSIQGK